MSNEIPELALMVVVQDIPHLSQWEQVGSRRRRQEGWLPCQETRARLRFHKPHFILVRNLDARLI
jgi:hypothetical protein